MVQPDRIVVLGGGTAGFLTALCLRKTLPETTNITVLQSSKLGVIGVGEGSLRQLPDFLHNYLQIDPNEFFAQVRPTWKLGIRFLWGPRPEFNYTFAHQVDTKHPHPELPRSIGFYCFDEFDGHCVASEMMNNDLVFLRTKEGGLAPNADFGYHMENQRLAEYLQTLAERRGIRIVDDLVTDVVSSDKGIEMLKLESGNTLAAPYFVDCSGFASILLGKTLNEPFIPYTDSLFCDRAVIGGWDRSEEPIHPYTTSETMQSGWCWQIEHETRINRGYVYSSDFVSDEQAEEAFRKRNRKIRDTNLVKFRSGRFQRAWVKNVIAIGNSAGFVEPLEATAIAAICSSARALAETFGEHGGDITPTLRTAFNEYNARSWDTIADFLAVHYKFNNRIDSEFWRACQAQVDLRGAAQIVNHYIDNGPSSLCRLTLEDPICRFRLDGYYTLLIGQKVPHRKLNEISKREMAAWRQLQAATRRYASNGLKVGEALHAIGKPGWRWHTNAA